MKIDSSVLKIIIIITLSVTVVGTISIYVTTSTTEKHIEDITNHKKNQIKFLSHILEERFSHNTEILELASKQPASKNVDYASNISEELKGIPENMDVEKRQIARDILSTSKDLTSVGFFMPNGDTYFAEPYSHQQNLQKLNFAFRDWYKGVISTNKPYVSETYQTQYTDKKTVAIAVPVRSADDSLIGIWHTVFDLEFLENEIDKILLEKNAYIMFFDHNKQLAVDSEHKSSAGEEITYLGTFVDKALQGEDGIYTEKINSVDTFIVYHPIRAGTNNWAAIMVQPYDDAFSSAISIRNLSLIMTSIIILVLLIGGYFAYSLTRSNAKVTNRLREVEREKEEFSAMVTHELKTPLIPILGYCKMFKTSMLGKMNEEEASAIEVIESNTKRLEELISNIMDVRKLDLGKMKFHFENLSLNEFFDNLESSYKKILKEKGIEFVTKLSIKDGVIYTDKTRLRQVFDNLISNSMKFVSDNNGLIEVGGYKEKSSLILYVKDNGIGIPKDKQSELFNKFYQIDTSERRKAGGTGLGLTISEGIMENLGGTIWVESDGKTGTTFYLKLPLKE